MVCKHLQLLEKEIIQAGIKETFRGQAWSKNCREWVYFDCYLDRESLIKRFSFPDCIVEHEHHGTHDGQEAGFICEKCADAVMGHYSMQDSKIVFA
jgi:hypothetical protein